MMADSYQNHLTFVPSTGNLDPKLQLCLSSSVELLIDARVLRIQCHVACSTIGISLKLDILGLWYREKFSQL